MRLQTPQKRFTLTVLVGLILLLLFAVLSLRLGAVPTPFSQILHELQTGEGITYKYRLPRLLIALFVGINMALSGTVLQNITRNPLAAPDIIGVSAGGGLASVIMLLTVQNYNPLLLPFVAFAGAIIAGVIVYLLSYRNGGIKPDRLALCGVAVSAGVQAIITLLIVKYSLNAAQALVWLKGSLYARSWLHVRMIWPWTVGGGILAILAFRQLNLLLLQEETVRGLGLRIERTRLLLLAVAIGLAGSSVAVAGTIGFIGLVIPHAARLLVGSDARLLLPTSALLGALLVTLADTVGRIVMPPIEIPAGIITALLGAPYFIYLLVRRKTSM
ncbi:MAG TPA: iron ABC transporter permease [Bacilli bacterium]|nr:iron ABC transporter permease [Bacilli bacterium]